MELLIGLVIAAIGFFISLLFGVAIVKSLLAIAALALIVIFLVWIFSLF